MAEFDYNPDAAQMARESSFLLDSLLPFCMKCCGLTVALASVAVALLYVKQDHLLYFPAIGGVPRRPRDNPKRYRSPSDHKLPFENHMIPCEDGVTIHSWLVLQQDHRVAPTVIFFHGNAGNIGLRLPNAVQMYHHLKCNVFMVEYRGYGDSDTIKPNERGLKLDAEAALKFLIQQPNIDPTKVFVFGRSLGGAVGFHLSSYAERNGIQLAGLIVENTFTSIRDMVDHIMPLVAPLKGLVLRIGWDSLSIAPFLRLPVLYLAGGADELVPHSHMRRLYVSSQRTSSLVRLHVVKGGRHNETWLQGGRAYWEAIVGFMNDAIAIAKAGPGYKLGGGESASGENRMDRSVSFADVEEELNGSVAPMKSPIPLMPGDLVGMAREAASSSVSTVTSSTGNEGKKKEL